MNRSLSSALLAAAALSAAPAYAQLTPQQALDRRAIGDLQFSPDGARLAFVVTEPPKGTSRNSDIWMLDLNSREVRQLTQAPQSDNQPRWSPDGGRLAFLSGRDGATQIYLLDFQGGEPRRLTDGKIGVQSFEWSPDGNSLAFLATEPKTDAEKRQEEEKDDARVVDKDDKPTRVWMLEVPSGRVRQVTTGAWSAGALLWFPDNQRLLVDATDQPHSDRWTDRLFSLDAATGQLTEIAAPRGPFGRALPSPDGARLAYVGSRVDGPSPHDLYLVPAAGGPARNLTATGLDRPVGSFLWREDGSLLALVETGFSSALYSIQPDGMATRLADPPVSPGAVAWSRSGAMAIVGQSTTDAPEVWVAGRQGAFQRATHLNDKWKDVAVIKPELIHYKSADGVEIEAALLKPPSAASGEKLPLVVLAHGGPTGRWTDTFEPWGQLLAARGYLVVYPNVRGSTGYGERFVEMNRGDWGGGDFQDVMAGVDYLINQGLADPDRLGIAGWSYGGYMAEWAITQTNRFKAAVSGAGMADLASEFGTEGSSAYDEWFFGAPYEKPRGFIQHSPITYIKNARTPTLILQGENDATDPIGQSQQLYRGLKRYGVESDFVVYPREPHGLREEKHLLDRLTRILAWFDAHLKPGATSSR